MINFGKAKYAQLATVWEVEDKGTYAVVSMSTSRKDKKTDEYVNTNWKFVRFVGTAYNEELLALERQTRIVLESGGISCEPYTDKDGNKAWPKQPQVVVFAWGYPENDGKTNKKGGDEAPEVEETDELPF